MTQQIRDVVRRYVELVGSGSTADILALYSEDAVIEDPVGTDPKKGHAEIGAFYDVITGLERETVLDENTVRVAEGHAAFLFTLTTRAGDQSFAVSPIDVMEFDEAGRITHMRAYWSQENMRIS